MARVLSANHLMMNASTANPVPGAHIGASVSTRRSRLCRTLSGAAGIRRPSSLALVVASHSPTSSSNLESNSNLSVGYEEVEEGVEVSGGIERRRALLGPLCTGLTFSLSGRVQAMEQEQEIFDEAILNEITVEDFQRIVLDEGRTTMLMFYAPWCPYCKKMAPKWGQMADELKKQGSSVVVARLNTDPTNGYVPYTDPDGNPVALRVSAYPTLALFKNGKTVKVNVGAGAGGLTGGYLGPLGVSRLIDFATS